MRKLAVIIGGMTISATLAVGPVPACADPIASAASALGDAARSAAAVEQVGCYRWGESGYHWYRFCFGPRFIYPHHRHCHHGHCWYH